MVRPSLRFKYAKQRQSIQRHQQQNNLKLTHLVRTSIVRLALNFKRTLNAYTQIRTVPF